MLKLKEEVETQYLQLVCYIDNMERNTEVVSYGYPVVEGVDGYPVDLYINDYLSPNTLNEYDISLLISEKSKISDYSGMSGIFLPIIKPISCALVFLWNLPLRYCSLKLLKR